MPIIRNPFKRQDENIRPANAASSIEQNVNGTKALDIKEKEPAEYKLSEINDSGICLPPSPPERKSFWSSTSRTTSSTSTQRSSIRNDNEPFSISRESFDSYRRSFDISGRSPVIQASDNSRPPRASLDSRTFLPPPPPRTSNSFTRPSQVPAQTKEESDNFEDVDISAGDRPAQPPKKRGLFSRITDSGDHSERPGSADGKSGSSWHHFGGRKRGQSGQGAELGSIPKRDTTPKPESQLKKEQLRPAVAPPKIEVNEPTEQAKPTEEARDGLQSIDLNQQIDGDKDPTDVTPKAKESRLSALKPRISQAPEIS